MRLEQFLYASVFVTAVTILSGRVLGDDREFHSLGDFLKYAVDVAFGARALIQSSRGTTPSTHIVFFPVCISFQPTNL
jgi:hypothetical protein